MTQVENSLKQNSGFLSSFIGKLSFISIAITGVGILINNMYLLEYDIIDFNLIQPRNIFTGITFGIYLSIYLIVYLFKLDISNLKKYSYLEIVFHLIVKFFIIVSGLFYLLKISGDIKGNKEYDILSLLSIAIPIMFLFNFMADAIFSKEEMSTLIHKVSFNFSKWFFSLIIITTFIYSYIVIPEYAQFAKSQTTFFFLALGIFLAIKSVQTKIKMAQNGEKDFEPTKSLFTENHFDYDNIVEKFFKYLFGTIFIVYGMYVYSIYIHSHIPTNFGGAKKYEISLKLLTSEKVKGKLIFQNEDKYYIKKGDEILFIKKDDVAKTYLTQE
jgi:hypothetical protein